MSSVFKWPPLESDPEIFNNYFWKIGLPANYYFGEIFSMDSEMLEMIPQTTFAVIANINSGNNKFCYLEDNDKKYTDIPFFMRQEGDLDMACGLIASLHALGNANLTFDKDSILERFYSVCKGKDDHERCKILSDMNDFKIAHEEFSSQGQSKLCENENEVSGHYICFIIINNNLYELNGAHGKPYIINNNVDQKDFLSLVSLEIKNRLENGFISEQLSMMYIAS